MAFQNNVKTVLQHLDYNNPSNDKTPTPKRKLTDHEDLPMHLQTDGPKSTPKRSRLSTEINHQLKQVALDSLKQFAEVSTKYTEFLHRKLGNAANPEALIQNNKERLMRKLKYFRGELKPYQLEGVIWLIVLYEKAVNGILADDMGLGKTVQMIALFCHLYERNVPGPFLIVAPLSTLSHWESEFKRFAPDLPVLRLQGSVLEREDQKNEITKVFTLEGRKVKPIVVCSYQIPLYEHQFLQRFAWQYIVVDEGHRIKNIDSKLSQELRALKSINRTLLTGTPLQNDLKELWALFFFLIPNLFKNFETFAEVLSLDDMKDKGRLLEVEAKNKVISTIHKVVAPFMLRREKRLVLGDLVPKKELIIYCSLSKMQDYLYRAVLANDSEKLYMQEPAGQLPVRERRKSRKSLSYASYFKPDSLDLEEPTQTESNITSPINLKLYNKPNNLPFKCPNTKYSIYVTMQNHMVMMRKVCSHPYLVWTPVTVKKNKKEMFLDQNVIKHSGKLLVLDAMLPKLRERGHKVLIFSTLCIMLDLTEEMLIMRGHKYVRLDGSMNSQRRTENIDDFSVDPEVFVFLLSTRAGGLGLNLVAADTVIFLDKDWNPQADLQAQDRCYRIGQTRPVVIYNLITKGTIEQVVWDRANFKRRLERIVLQEGKFRGVQNNFDADQLNELRALLESEVKLKEVNSNGLLYSEEQLDEILDRSDLVAGCDKSD